MNLRFRAFIESRANGPVVTGLLWGALYANLFPVPHPPVPSKP